MDFVGRRAELRLLSRELDLVRRGGSRPGRCLLLRGRRRVGKSRLAEAFIAGADVPSVFFTAAGGSPAADRAEFAREVLASDLPGRRLFDGVRLDSWGAALRLLAAALPQDAPSVVVLDEVPYLTAADPDLEGVLQRAWDRLFSHRPVLLVLIGSDLSTMTALNDHGRPFHQRGTPMLLAPLNPADLAAMLDLPPADAVDAYLVTGGLPLICADWPTGADRREMLRDALSVPTSALVVSAELSLAAEFPAEANARAVLSAIGSGERTFSAVQRAAGVPAASLARTLDQLARKQLVAAERPLSTTPSKETRYRIEDPYLRFWLFFLGRHLAEIDRGRGDRVLDRIDRGWTSWRGRAVEPVVRDALRRTGPDAVVGAYWTRSSDVEVDLVGADRGPVARRVSLVGSVKWREEGLFDHHDLSALITARGRVPGATADTALVAVSRTGTDPGLLAGGLLSSVGPAELVAAWS